MTERKNYATIKKKVLLRDDFTCQKCGHHRNLEVHHIIPVVNNGTNTEGNLITLCGSCHKYAPDDCIELFKYLKNHLPPDLERSSNLTKSLINFVIYRFKLLDYTDDNFTSKITEINKYVDDSINHIWLSMASDSIVELAKMFEGKKIDDEIDGSFEKSFEALK